jgi:hypothetical protein
MDAPSRSDRGLSLSPSTQTLYLLRSLRSESQPERLLSSPFLFTCKHLWLACCLVRLGGSYARKGTTCQFNMDPGVDPPDYAFLRST